MSMQIRIEKLRFETVIGILPQERTQVQSVEVDALIDYRYAKGKYLDYVEAVDLIRTMLQNGKYGLIEDALEDLIQAFSERFEGLEKIEITIWKPDILCECIVGVTREKSFL
ncbi:dihydroneopterin aldolase [Nitratifractor sp.]